MQPEGEIVKVLTSREVILSELPAALYLWIRAIVQNNNALWRDNQSIQGRSVCRNTLK